jgi:hypothetical protein
MATWYRATRYSTTVTPVEVLNETEKSLMVKDSQGEVHRRAKSNDVAQYFPTRREALLYHRNRLRSSIESAHARLRQDQVDLRTITLQLDEEAAHGQVAG